MARFCRNAYVQRTRTMLACLQAREAGKRVYLKFGFRETGRFAVIDEIGGVMVFENVIPNEQQEGRGRMTSQQKSAARTESKPARSISLDMFRGLAIAGMKPVNNAENRPHAYPVLAHAESEYTGGQASIFPYLGDYKALDAVRGAEGGFRYAETCNIDGFEKKLRWRCLEP